MHSLRGALAVVAVTVVLAPVPLHAAPTAAQKCAIAKNKAASKKLGSKLKCYQKGIAASTSPDSTCLAKAEVKFSVAAAKADLAGGCAVTGDASVLEGIVDRQVEAVAGFTPVAVPVCCFDGSGACWYGATAGDCGVWSAGAAGTVCDGATGGCVASPGTAGHCCSSSAGLTSFPNFNCAVGPELDLPTCAGVGGTTFDANALCAPVPAAPVSATGPTCVRF